MVKRRNLLHAPSEHSTQTLVQLIHLHVLIVLEGMLVQYKGWLPLNLVSMAPIKMLCERLLVSAAQKVKCVQSMMHHPFRVPEQTTVCWGWKSVLYAQLVTGRD